MIVTNTLGELPIETYRVFCSFLPVTTIIAHVKSCRFVHDVSVNFINSLWSSLPQILFEHRNDFFAELTEVDCSMLVSSYQQKIARRLWLLAANSSWSAFTDNISGTYCAAVCIPVVLLWRDFDSTPVNESGTFLSRSLSYFSRL